VYIENRKA